MDNPENAPTVTCKIYADTAKDMAGIYTTRPEEYIIADKRVSYARKNNE